MFEPARESVAARSDATYAHANSFLADQGIGLVSEGGKYRMSKRFLPRLRYADVVATLALFGMLAGGGAYAASKIGSKDIARGAVKSKQLARAAVKSKHLAKKAVKSKHLAKGTVKGNHLAKGAVQGKHLAKGAVGGAQIKPGSISPAQLQKPPIWAVVNADGTIRAQSGGVSVVHSETGVTILDVGVNADKAAAIATVLDHDGQNDGPASAAVCSHTPACESSFSGDPRAVRIVTTNIGHVTTALPFYVAVLR